jgi:hypothetical protein
VTHCGFICPVSQLKLIHVERGKYLRRHLSVLTVHLVAPAFRKFSIKKYYVTEVSRTVTQDCRQMALEMSSNLENMKSCIWLKSSYRTCKLRTITLSVRSAWVVSDDVSSFEETSNVSRHLRKCNFNYAFSVRF